MCAEHHHQWFTIEYAHVVLVLSPRPVDPGRTDTAGRDVEPLPAQRLRTLGAWDPYNVTEDCDLGIRMFREHYQIKVLESPTLEEANSDFVNWVKQRSRWYKGYLQTFLIHLRSPAQLVRRSGSRVRPPVRLRGRTPILAVFNPVFWFLTLMWFVAHPRS